MSTTEVRLEAAGDAPWIHQVHAAAFEADVEAGLVDAVRRSKRPTVSLVAVEGDRVVGHILFTPVSVDSNPEKKEVWGLGPMSVLPARQRCGIGSLLVKEGLERCRLLGAEAVVVLGHPEFYPRFGFGPAGESGLHFRDEKFDPFFMIAELRPGAVSSLGGFVEYVPEFDEV